VKKGGDLLLKNIDEIEAMIRKHYGPRRPDNPRVVAEKIAQILDQRYSDIAFLFRVIAYYRVEEINTIIKESMRFKRKIKPVTLIEALYSFIKDSRGSFHDKMRSAVEASLKQYDVEIVDVDDSGLLYGLDSSIEDKEDEYQMRCIKRYMQGRPMDSAKMLTIDSRLKETAGRHNVEVELYRARGGWFFVSARASARPYVGGWFDKSAPSSSRVLGREHYCAPCLYFYSRY
jgi:hypothetical protein